MWPSRRRARSSARATFSPATSRRWRGGEVDALAEEVSPADVPQVPEASVAYIDGFGNLKTTFRFEELGREVGSSLHVHIGDVTKEASLSDGSFAVPKGALAFSPGKQRLEGRQNADSLDGTLFTRGERLGAVRAAPRGQRYRDWLNGSGA